MKKNICNNCVIKLFFSNHFFFLTIYFNCVTELSSVPALPAPGPQAYPPGVDPPKIVSFICIFINITLYLVYSDLLR